VGAELDEAADELYRAPFGAFVDERKRLAAALKRGGRADDAKALAALAKPPLSAWVINALYWNERGLLDELFDATSALRAAKVRSDAFTKAMAAQRASLARLRSAAEARLQSGGHAASDALLRRVVTTLQALAAAGSFAPDPPGRLTGDRDPLGFEAMAETAVAEAPARPPPAPKDGAGAAKARAHEEARAALARAEVERHDAERAAATVTARSRELAVAAEAEVRKVRAAEEAVAEAERAAVRAKEELERARRRADEATARAAEGEKARDAAAAIVEARRRAVEAARAELAARHPKIST